MEVYKIIIIGMSIVSCVALVGILGVAMKEHCREYRSKK